MMSHGRIIELPQAAFRRDILVFFVKILEHLLAVLSEVVSHEAHVRLRFLRHASTTDELLSQSHSILAC